MTYQSPLNDNWLPRALSMTAESTKPSKAPSVTIDSPGPPQWQPTYQSPLSNSWLTKAPSVTTDPPDPLIDNQLTRTPSVTTNSPEPPQWQKIRQSPHSDNWLKLLEPLLGDRNLTGAAAAPAKVKARLTRTAVAPHSQLTGAVRAPLWTAAGVHGG